MPHFAHTTVDGKRIAVEVKEDGTVIVSGSPTVQIGIPYAYYGNAVRFFPSEPEGGLEIEVSAPTIGEEVVIAMRDRNGILLRQHERYTLSLDANYGTGTVKAGATRGVRCKEKMEYTL